MDKVYIIQHFIKYLKVKRSYLNIEQWDLMWQFVRQLIY